MAGCRWSGGTHSLTISVHTVSLTPESMRKKVGESSEALPIRGSAGEAMVEAGIDEKVLSHRIGRGPEIPDRGAVGQWLCEVPQLTGNRQFSDWMRDR